MVAIAERALINGRRMPHRERLGDALGITPKYAAAILRSVENQGRISLTPERRILEVHT
ncbi:hypothetical protein [Acidocella sp.]|uniref:hypothetical protein n=1 Tax=Acidocella sp. TaxID=50710 RepID=UPI00260BAF10|nr:hypothetical protein [Acidocella sp.]